MQAFKQWITKPIDEGYGCEKTLRSDQPWGSADIEMAEWQNGLDSKTPGKYPELWEQTANIILKRSNGHPQWLLVEITDQKNHPPSDRFAQIQALDPHHHLHQSGNVEGRQDDQ